MTVRLAAMAEEHMKRIINDWKASCRKQNKNMKLNGNYLLYFSLIIIVILFEGNMIHFEYLYCMLNMCM